MEPSVPPSNQVWRSVRADGDTKTEKSRRTLQLPIRCVDVLKAHRAKQTAWRDRAGERCQEHVLVFSTHVGTELDAANVRRSFRNVVKKAGLDPTAWTPRELRHSFVSLLSNNGGVSIEDISHLVGHASTVVTQKVYRKELRPVLRRGAKAMDTVFTITVDDQAVDRQLDRQVPESGESSAEDEAENHG